MDHLPDINCHSFIFQNVVKKVARTVSTDSTVSNVFDEYAELVMHSKFNL